MNPPEFTPSEETLRLEKYISAKKHGEDFTYAEAMRECGINIKTPAGRGKFYTACKRLGRECICIPNYGYRLSSPNTVFEIIDQKVNRVVSGIKRTETASGNLLTCHSEQMTPSQREAVSFTNFQCAAALGSVKSAKAIVRKEHPVLSEVKPVI
jgi:hypothetical protein